MYIKNLAPFVIAAGMMAISGCGMFSSEGKDMVPAEYTLIESSENFEAEPYITVPPAEAMEIIKDNNNVVIVDVRPQEKFDAGHIPGAINIPVTEIVDKAESVFPDKKADILVYCGTGDKSQVAAIRLADMGYEHVIEMTGGLEFWKGALVTTEEEKKNE